MPALCAAGTIVLTLIGELDIATTEVFNEHLRDLQSGPTQRFLIDLSQLRFMGSAGLRSSCRSIAPQLPKGTPSFRPGPSQVQRLFKITEMDKLLTFE